MMKRTAVLLLLAALLCALCVTASAETLNSYFKASFNKSPAFYTGPGTSYFRAGNGKAQYGGHGEARVYGYVGDWLLLGYQTGAGNYRIGYFQKSYLANMTVKSESYNLRQLNFEYRRAWINTDCDITDDPVLKFEPFAELQTGDACTYLASYDNRWAYIEVTVGSKKARGFVPLRNVSYTAPAPSTLEPSPVGGNGFYNGGTWATVSGQMSAYSGPGVYYTPVGTYYMQNQAIYCLAKHYDYSTRSWWVLCRIFDGSAAQYVWVQGTSFYNTDWLLARLAQE